MVGLKTYQHTGNNNNKSRRQKNGQLVTGTEFGKEVKTDISRGTT